MKKLIFTLLISTMAMGIATAQDAERRWNGERRGGGGQNDEMMEMVKQRVKSEFKLSDENTDSVVAYHFTAQRKARMLDRNTEMSEAAKKEKVAEINAEKNAKLKAILSEKQMKKLEEYFENMRNGMRTQRQGQGGQQGID